MNLNNLNQHLLIDPDVIKHLVDEISTDQGSPIVEIGPGTGNITKELIKLNRKIYAIEKDKALASRLQEIYGNRINVINENVINYNLPPSSVVVGNIPFNITEPLIEKLIGSRVSFCVFVIGSSFVDGLDLTKKITKLSLLTNCFFKCELIMDVNKKSFEPAPRTNAKLLRLEPSKPGDIKLRIFRDMFLNRNKLMKNALMESLVKNCKKTKNESRLIIAELKISGKILETKIENLSNSDFGDLYHRINDC